MADSKKPQTESQERKEDSKGSDQYGAGPGSSGSGNVGVRSHTPENRAGELNPSAPTDATEGPSTNLANNQAQAARPGTTDGAARGENSAGNGKQPSSKKHDAA